MASGAAAPSASEKADREWADCALCGGTEHRVLAVARDLMLGRPGTFPVVQCRACGLVFLSPRPSPEALGTYYPDRYYPLEAEPSAEELAVAKWYFRQVGRWAAARDLAEPRLLDVGCGAGLFLRQAQAAGWRVSGVEPSASASDYARARYGLQVHCGTLADAPLGGETFDIVTLWHVLEHTAEPAATLRQAAAVLAPGGLLLVAVPNFASFEAKAFGRRWYSLDAPRHLYDFTPDTLEALLLKAGLTVERVVHSPGSAGLAYSVMGDLTGVSLRLRGRQLSEKAYLRALGGVSRLSSPFCALAARLGHGGALEVYARKPAP